MSKNSHIPKHQIPQMQQGMSLPVQKVVIHKSDQQDTIFIFTPCPLLFGVDHLSIRFPVPCGYGERWVQQHIKNVHYEIVSGDMEVCAP